MYDFLVTYQTYFIFIFLGTWALGLGDHVESEPVLLRILGLILWVLSGVALALPFIMGTPL